MPGDVVRCGEWIGVAGRRPGTEPPPFGEIGPGWYGSATLAAAVEPARRLRGGSPDHRPGRDRHRQGGDRARDSRLERAAAGPFVAVNCAALPAELAEAELFGYRKGAFTGADQTSPGLFRAAEGGSIFLDEILELPLALQPKLLRVLEERRVRALGETRDVPIDVRVIAATQEPLGEAVAAKRFRADLHARLDGLTVVLPPLRARREDIVPLFLELLRQHAGGRPPAVEPKLAEALCLYDWPLNVRELVLLARRLLGLHGARVVAQEEPPAGADAAARTGQRRRARASRTARADAGDRDRAARAARDRRRHRVRGAHRGAAARRRQRREGGRDRRASAARAPTA